MRSDDYGEINIVSPARLILRSLRGPVLLVVFCFIFVDRYGVPTLETKYQFQNGFNSREVASYSLEFKPLERSAIFIARDWLAQ